MVGLATATAVSQESRPNVLFIAVDDLKPAIGAFGDPVARTPNLDRLAQRGTVFLNAHCQQAVCAPSRVSLLLGLRPDTTRVWDLKTEFRRSLPDAVTLPERFKRAGYQVVGMGKVFDARSVDGRGMDLRSWTEAFVHVTSPADATFSFRNPAVVGQVDRASADPRFPAQGRRPQIDFAFPEGRPPTDRAGVADDAYHDGAMTEAACARLEGFAGSGQAFFLAVGFKKPHLPFNAPERYWRMYDENALPLAGYQGPPRNAPSFASQPGWELRANYRIPKRGRLPEPLQRELIHGYYACVSYVDAQVGKLLATLEELGLAQNTIVVLWGDHGWHLGDHAIWCKHTNYEQATRSPLLIVVPEGVPGAYAHGGRSLSPVELLDVYPTLLDLAGLEPLGDLHGVSLRAILEDPAASVKPVAVSQFPRDAEGRPVMGYAYRSDRYRLVQWRTRDAQGDGQRGGAVVHVELYDYQADPLETRSVADAAEYAGVRAAMEAHAEAMSHTHETR